MSMLDISLLANDYFIVFGFISVAVLERIFWAYLSCQHLGRRWKI